MRRKEAENSKMNIFDGIFNFACNLSELSQKPPKKLKSRTRVHICSLPSIFLRNENKFSIKKANEKMAEWKKIVNFH